MSTRKLYATLIGIDNYPHHPLAGCIQDVLAIDKLLREQCAQQPEKLEYVPLYFLAPNEADLKFLKNHVILVDYDPPVFQLLTTKAFTHLQQATDGDICVFYYSGHGSRITSAAAFADSKSDGMSETIVCVDSRDVSNPASRDIIDKELAYLFWKTFKGKDIHSLVIMDCCHAGNNTRALSEVGQLRSRMDTPSSLQVPLSSYIGFDDTQEKFYTVVDGKAAIPYASYVKLSAAQDYESALETEAGGLFTAALVSFIRTGGGTRSYQGIMQHLTVSVNNQAVSQHPLLEANPLSLMDLTFLGNGVVPFQQSFEVLYVTDDYGDAQWTMYGGRMNGILASRGKTKTLVRIAEANVIAEVSEVTGNTAILSGAALENLDKDHSGYRAVLQQMAGAAVKVGLSENLKANTTAVTKLTEIYQDKPAFRLYLDIDFDGKYPDHDYLIDLIGSETWWLREPDAKIPLFQATADLGEFLDDVNVVGRWKYIAGIRNANSQFNRNDFEVKLEIIEGELLGGNNTDQLTGTGITGFQLEDDIRLAYKNKRGPAFRFSISIKPAAAFEECFIGALYLGAAFGIEANLVESSAGRLIKGGAPVQLQYLTPPPGSRNEVTIPVKMDKVFKAQGRLEIADLLQIFVATDPIDLSNFKQAALKLDPVNYRGTNLSYRNKSLGGDNGDPVPFDWTVFSSRVLIRAEINEQALSDNGTDFSLFKVTVPAGFSGTATAVTSADLQTPTRDVKAAWRNPATIWGDVYTDNVVFKERMQRRVDNGVQALELKEVNGVELISAENPIVITPKFKGAATRSVAEVDETIVPYGYDAVNDIYTPLGYEDAEGNIIITGLPSVTPGTLAAAAINYKSIGSSIKLYFCKLFHKPVFGFKLYSFDNGLGEMITDDPAAMKPYLGQRLDKKIVLLVHGIFGDTTGMLAAMREMPELPADTAYVLTYDYENLAGSIEKSAQMLYDCLSETGIQDAGNKVTIIAHSMGGLVSRYMIELQKGNCFADHLILVGTPSLGSEITDLALGIVSLITHALNTIGPIKYALPVLSFLMKKAKLDPTNTLKEMQPDSPILKILNAASCPGDVKYSLIGGNTGLIKSQYTGNDSFFRRLPGMLQRGLVYPGFTLALYGNRENDMAVTVESMAGASGLNGNGTTKIIACDHISYFQDDICRNLLLAYMQPKLKSAEV